MSLEKATPAWTIPWEDSAVTSVTFLGSSRRLAAGNEQGQILIFDLAEKQDGPAPVPVRRLDGHTNVVTALALLPGANRLVSASYDHTMRWWDLSAASEGTGPVVLPGWRIIRAPTPNRRSPNRRRSNSAGIWCASAAAPTAAKTDASATGRTIGFSTAPSLSCVQAPTIAVGTIMNSEMPCAACWNAASPRWTTSPTNRTCR